MEFIFYWFYLKLYYLKDSFYSWYRYPITDFNIGSTLFKFKHLSLYLWTFYDENCIFYNGHNLKFYKFNLNSIYWIKFMEFDTLIIDYIIWSISQLDYILDFEYFDETMWALYFFFL
jgi:hypothetical protein